MVLWQSFLLNFSLSLVKKYIDSTETTQDDKILNLVKDGAKYLSDSDSNSFSAELADSILRTKILTK